MSQAINATSAVLALSATVFFIVGCAGYSLNNENMDNVPWITYKEDGFKFMFNLEGIRYKTNAADGHVNWNSDNCESTFDFCNRCEKDGRSAISLIVIATVFSAIVTGLSGALSASYNSGLQIANVVLSFISAAFAIIGFSMFMGDCYQEIDQAVHSDLHWGSGSIITCLAFLIMFIVTILQLVSTIVGGGSA